MEKKRLRGNKTKKRKIKKYESEIRVRKVREKDKMRIEK